MPTVANLAVSVTARTSKFNRQMKGARKSVTALGREVVDVGKRLVQFGALAGGAAIAGLTLATKQSFALIDATSKLADTFGIATDQLIGLQHGAVLTGGTVEGMGKALKEFVRRLGEASTRTGEMRDALAMLGFDAQILVLEGTAEAMKAVFDRIAALPNEFEQAEAAYRVFGRQGTVFIKLMRMGSKGVEEFVREVEKMGLTFTDLGAAGVENANDALFRLRQTMRGTANQIALRLQPFVAALATALVDVATAGDGVRSRVATAFEFVETAIGKVLNATVLLEAEWFAFQGVILGTADLGVRALGKLTTAMANSLQGLSMLTAAIARSQGDIALVAALPIIVALGNASIAVRKLADETGAISQALGEGMDDAMAKMESALDRFRTGSAAKGFMGWVQDIRDTWNELARQTLEQPRLGITPLASLESLRAAGAGARARTAEFQQIALSRVAIQGVNTPGRPQIVRDPQLVDTNATLNRILNALSVTRFALTS